MLANSEIYIAILCVVRLSLFVVLILGAVFVVKSFKIRSWLKKNKDKKSIGSLKKKRGILKQTKKKLKCCIALLVIVSLLLSFLIVARQNMYAMSEGFIWSEEERGVNAEDGNKSLTFEVLMREYGEWWWKEAIYYSWYERAFCDENGNFDGIIDEEGFTYYRNKFIALCEPNRVQKDEIKNPDERDTGFEADRDLFSDVVGQKEADLVTLWKGFKAGQRVQENNKTSENVFQTGVLAEKAHNQVYNRGITDEQSIVYLAGMYEQFDLFLTFEELRAGEDVYVSEDEVNFRKAKCSYNEGRFGVQEERVKIHCAVMAYVLFSYLAEKTDPTDSNYLLYTYYSGLAFLHIMAEIEGEAYREGLCRKELGRWDYLLLDEIDYEKEGMDIKNILKVKERLEFAMGK